MRQDPRTRTPFQVHHSLWSINVQLFMLLFHLCAEPESIAPFAPQREKEESAKTHKDFQSRASFNLFTPCAE